MELIIIECIRIGRGTGVNLSKKGSDGYKTQEARTRREDGKKEAMEVQRDGKKEGDISSPYPPIFRGFNGCVW